MCYLLSSEWTDLFRVLPGPDDPRQLAWSRGHAALSAGLLLRGTVARATAGAAVGIQQALRQIAAEICIESGIILHFMFTFASKRCPKHLIA